MNDFKVMIEHNKYGDFIVVYYKNKKYTEDKEIVNFLCMTREQYREVMLGELNGEVKNKEIYFADLDKAVDACEWLKTNIDRFLMMRKLVRAT